MVLEVEFQIESTRILFQQNPQCRVVLRNTGRAPVSVLHPMTNPSAPRIRVLDVRRGIETVERRPGNFAGDRYQPLPPGQQLEHEFPLLGKVTLREPGEYEISAIFPYDDGRSEKESAPVRIDVRPVTLRGLHVVPVSGAGALVQHVTSMNVEDGEPSLVRYVISLLPGGGVLDVRPGPPVPVRAQVVASRPANGETSHTSWAGWIDAGELRGACFDPHHGLLELRRFPLPPTEAHIVAPMLTGAVPPSLERPGASVLLWLAEPRGDGGRLLVVDWAPNGKAVAGPNAPLPGRRPVWMASQVMSSTFRRMVFAQVTERGLSLGWTSWPKSRPEPPTSLAEWPVTFVAGGCTPAPDDTLHGALLVQTRRPDVQRVELLRWTLDPRHGFREIARDVVDWPYAVRVESAVVRLSAAGHAAALLADPEGRWSVLRPDGVVQPLPPAWATTRHPLDLVFKSDGTPLLLAARKEHGLAVLELDGHGLAAHGH